MEYDSAKKARIWNIIEENAQKRRNNGLLPNGEDEVNFFCGAMSAIYAMTDDMKNVPSNWCFGLMGNRRITKSK